jgi:hypothetical protein
MASSLISGSFTRLARPHGILPSTTFSRRWNSTGQTPELYTPTSQRTLGPNGGILLSPTAVQNLFNYPEFKHQKREILPFKKWRLVRTFPSYFLASTLAFSSLARKLIYYYFFLPSPRFSFLSATDAPTER